ncbi:MAG: hypothetical protein CVV48_14525 [Spirochaetae bacterium HGW-Spirochaetae-4]|nr:MAG: hypothetical protein CVV48_14525 [Spirochaetae bacterium HGW-Spirochaetae-4]
MYVIPFLPEKLPHGSRQFTAPDGSDQDQDIVFSAGESVVRQSCVPVEDEIEQDGQSLAFPPFVDMQNIASQAASQPRGQPSVVPRVGVADDQRLHGYSSGQWIVPLPL